MSTSRSQSAKKAWETRRKATYKASKKEKASKVALESWCQLNGWKVVFFEGKSGAPRTGIVDAVMTRIKPKDADAIEIKFVQLKSGSGGLTAREVSRLKKAVTKAATEWLVASYDGETMHFLSEASRQKDLN